MKIVISPAKIMEIDTPNAYLKPTTPQFISDSEHIMGHLREETPKEIGAVMKISDKLAHLNWERFQHWVPKPKKEVSAPAIFAYRGQAYQALDAPTFQDPDLDYLQKNLRMISGLYGVLKPSDKIMLYRLEMGCPYAFESYKNLYDFWTEKVTNTLNKELTKDEVVLNLASKEYFKAVDRKKLKAKIIDFDFKEIHEGKLKATGFTIKTMRGLVTRFCAQNQLKNEEEVKAFNLNGYLFNDELSTDTHFIFTK